MTLNDHYPQFQRSRHSLTLNISETVRDTDSVIEILIGTYTRPYAAVSFRMTLSDLEWLSKIFNDTKRTRAAWIWMRFYLSTTFESDPDHSPDAGTGKSNIDSRSNRHFTQSRLGHGMHYREILFTPLCSPRAREFPQSVNFLYDVQLGSYGASKLLNFRIFFYFPIQNA